MNSKWLSEFIEPFNTVQCILHATIVLLESIDLILAHYASIICLPIMLKIMLAYLTEAYSQGTIDYPLLESVNDEHGTAYT